MEPFDTHTRRLVASERREALARSARPTPSPLARRLGRLLIALGGRLGDQGSAVTGRERAAALTRPAAGSSSEPPSHHRQMPSHVMP